MSIDPTPTPASLGYTFPPEWHPHAGTWFSWPRPEGKSFPGKHETVPENLARIIREVAIREPAHINVQDAEHEHVVRAQLQQHGCPLDNIRFHAIRTNEPWCRDHGPAFVVRQSAIENPKSEIRNPKSEIAVLDWSFNSWGGKYLPCEDDDAVPTRIAAELDLPVFRPGIVMEGGSVDFNGQGTILTTTDCLLHPNRNPGLSREQIEQYLKDYYGQRHVCWLTGGIIGDDTDGHVDDLARFIDPRTIVIAVEDDPKDANHAALRDARQQLDHQRDQEGRPFRIVEIPMPHAVEHAGQRLPATYVNFYFVNGALLVPTYRDARNDARAIEILQSHLPDRQVVGVDCVELIWGRGAIHCLTQQMPA